MTRRWRWVCHIDWTNYLVPDASWTHGDWKIERPDREVYTVYKNSELRGQHTTLEDAFYAAQHEAEAANE
jgi:hypothetical protein